MFKLNRAVCMAIFITTGTFVLENAYSIEIQKYWIFFRDKGNQRLHEADHAAQALLLGISPKAVENRKKVRSADRIFDDTDLPLESNYLQIVRRMGIRILTCSRWLNAVSVFASKSAADTLRNLPFVKEVRPVASYTFAPPVFEKRAPVRIWKSSLHRLDYGISEDQNELIRVPEVHDLGFSGKGVVIGMLDSGFNYKNRRVFSSTSIVAEHDFWDDNNNTANEPGDPSGQDEHGTMTLSVIGGFQEGELIGTAYRASYALAKTEWIPFEKKIEENKWVTGIEWLVDSVGVDVVSSSLGYNTFPDDGNDIGYTYQDLNGRTCVTTIAADLAVSKGVVVVNSAGNEKKDSWHFIISPADGFNVLAVGAVSLEGTPASFSSVGPTFDGRTKPDVAAMGAGAYCANPAQDDFSDFVFAWGTSFSCPMVAGVCALILEAHPELTPMEVMEALRHTASQSNNPDNILGWGIVNAYEAILYHGMIFNHIRAVEYPFENRFGLQFDILSRKNIPEDSVIVHFAYLQNSSNADSATGSRQAIRKSGTDRVFYEIQFPDDVNPQTISFYISATDSTGFRQLSPRYAPEIKYYYSDLFHSPNSDTASIRNVFHLYQNFPNPFKENTCFEMDVFVKDNFDVRIFNVMGQEVFVYKSQTIGSSKVKFEWDGRNSEGEKTPSGIYFCQVKIKKESQVIKIIHIR